MPKLPKDTPVAKFKFKYQVEEEAPPLFGPVRRGPPSTEEEKQDFFFDLMHLKMRRVTNKKCADELGVSERTIVNYLADPLYREFCLGFEAENKASAHLIVSDMAYTALQTLKDLMDPDQTNSEYVRYSAARTVGEWLGLNVPKEETRGDAREEVAAFLEKLSKENPKIVTNNIQVNIGTGATTGEDITQSIIDALPSKQPRDALLLPTPNYEEFPQVEPGGKLPKGW